MRIIAIASNDKKLSQLTDWIGSDASIEIVAFIDPLLAIKYLTDNSADIVFADFSMKRINPIDFIRLAKKFCSNIQVYIVFDKESYQTISILKEDANIISSEEINNIIKKKKII